MSKIFLDKGNASASSSSSSSAAFSEFTSISASYSSASFSSSPSNTLPSSAESSKADNTSPANFLLFSSFSFSSSSMIFKPFLFFPPLSPSSSKSSSLDSFAIVLRSHFILALQKLLSCGAAHKTEYPFKDCIKTDNNSPLFDQVKLVNTNRFMVVSCSIRILPPSSRGSQVNTDLSSHTANLYFKCVDIQEVEVDIDCVHSFSSSSSSDADDSNDALLSSSSCSRARLAEKSTRLLQAYKSLHLKKFSSLSSSSSSSFLFFSFAANAINAALFLLLFLQPFDNFFSSSRALWLKDAEGFVSLPKSPLPLRCCCDCDCDCDCLLPLLP